MDISLYFYLGVALVMFFCGVYGFITRRNMIAMLISLELILNSVNVNFLAFNRFLYPESLDGMFFSLFVIGVAAAETAIAVAIIINVYRHVKKIDTEEIKEMKY
ncbi:MAG: NADH-quinone oxidoreductase subunit NuoK [Paludibacteraceae bacterium]|nr:NADH-quinone oxidoreductase subunit NuoK [Paludibacteraceae bacterium]